MPSVGQSDGRTDFGSAYTTTLADSERHGYGIVQDIAEHTRGKIRLVPGNLYSVLRRLMNLQVIDETPHRPAPDLDDERRRYYGITAFGKRVLAAEAERMRELVVEIGRWTSKRSRLT